MRQDINQALELPSKFHNNQELFQLRSEPPELSPAASPSSPQNNPKLAEERQAQEALTNPLSVDDAYYVEPTTSEPAQIVMGFKVDRKPSNGKYLVDDVTRILDAGTDQVAGTIESLATDHLRKATGTSARIHDDGYTINIRAELHVDSRTSQADTPTLTRDQTAALPGIELAVRNVLPFEVQEHASSVAARIAKELPTQTQVIDAYERPTLSEVIDHHQRQFSPSPGQPVALNTYLRSFPAHPVAALTDSPTPPKAATHSTATIPDLHSGPER
ncbi:hypothetical protein [Paenarthrobacter sp. 2TAF44]|uniref:hypothetical protein n=1 Tax=Paenarthrobacter sp. 2TAF44 TaxID=3233018 RepID=UPI003F987C38